ncbi:MAG TPA: ELM1/GtrOC1 family putative glycosyltransferase [Myxococcota bacterium]|jgi:mitochondrial fission protein ELM1|nr:ELM1/GtrOC1 family putative glycosyltransferase [Myxococcota bacterium]
MTSARRAEGAGASHAETPKVWLLMGHRAGDNAQLLALAEALGWPYEIKRFRYRRGELLTNLAFDATLLGRIGARSSVLGPPWPDLVISAGRRSEPIARWIRRHADPAPKLVHLGRPWRKPEAFDLVVVTPQYPVPAQDGVLRIPLPLHRVTPARLDAAAAEHAARLAHLPRPWIAVLVGGSSELFTLDSATATRLAREACAMVREAGGSLLVTTSARTPSGAIDALCAAVDVPAEIFRWTPDASENPYWGYVALADAFVVTGDSVSMLTEACATGKPVHIFDPGRARHRRTDALAAVRRRVLNLGIPRLSRDIRRIHAELVELGRATFLGEPFRAARSPSLDPVGRAVARVRALQAGTAEPVPAPREAVPRTPRVWAVLCYRAGDNSQILALAEGLGWPFEVKRLAYRPLGRLLDLFRGTTLLGIDEARSSPLGPPWPDLVISAAMRNEPVCRWIRKQSRGKTRYVHLGKPWARLSTFDLVVTVPEYNHPRRPNVVHNFLSLNRVTPARLAQEARVWEPAVAHLPRPFVAVLVGGYAGPHAFDREKAERLGREASAMARKLGGSLLVTTSGRTSGAALEGLLASIDVPHHLFRWSPGSRENPYFGFLALADAIVVTCDSGSMLSEACATGKPVYMFDLRRDDSPAEVPLPASGRAGLIARWWRRCNRDRVRAFLYRQVLLRLGPLGRGRDIGALHRALISSGRVVWLGETFPTRPPPPINEMPRTCGEVRALWSATPAPAPAARDSVAPPRAERRSRDELPFAIPAGGGKGPASAPPATR